MASRVMFDPIVHLYLLHLGGLLVAALWPGQPRASRPQDDGGSPSFERGKHFPETTEDGDSSLAPPWNWGMTGRVLLPIRELKALWSAEYSARFSSAIKHVRKE